MSRRGWRSFVVPGHESQRVPLGRTAIVAVIVTALAFLGYSLAKDGVRLPFSEEPFVVKAEMADASGLHADNEPPVSVAGVPSGRIVDVEYVGGTAHVTMELDPSVRGKLFNDARMRIRMQNGANVLSVDVRPGTPKAGVMQAGATIPPRRTQAPVLVTDVVSMLDADTRAYVSVILGESREALGGSGGKVADAFASVGSAIDPAAEVSRVLSRRRDLVSDLVGDVDVLFRTLADRRDELATTVDASGRILRTGAAHEQQLAAAVRAAPAVLEEADRTQAAFTALTPSVSRIMDRALPVARRLGPAMRGAKTLLPEISGLLTAIDRLTREGQKPVGDLVTLLDNLEGSQADIDRTFSKVEKILRGLDEHRLPLADAAEAVSGLTGQQDNRSALGRMLILGFEAATPESFGLPNTATGRAKLARELPRALVRECGDRAEECADKIIEGDRK